MKKVFLTIALICLSTGAFAQIYATTIYFAQIPHCPPDRSPDIRMTFTWHLITGPDIITSIGPIVSLPPGGMFTVTFPYPDLADLVEYTKIDLAFHNNYCGTSQVFHRTHFGIPGIPWMVAYPIDFKGPMWWLATQKKLDN